MIEKCYDILFIGALVVLALCVIAALVYIIRSHFTVDRIIGINLIGTIVTIIICILSLLLDEAYLVDVAIIYVVMAFIAVMMLCRIYISLYARRKEEGKE